MKNFLSSVMILGIVVWASLLFPNAANGQVTVYDNTTNITFLYYPGQLDNEGGDELNLAGVSRVITRLELAINAAQAGTVDLQARIYDNNGTFTAPDTLLWASTVMDDVPVDGIEVISFDVPFVAVPDIVIYTLVISDNQTGGEVGQLIFDPPTVGTSEDWFWEDTAGWNPYFFGGDPVANFYALIEAAMPVDIDIKFCSDPNAFNCRKKGVLPVTIFGADDFDATDIDLSTVRLCLEDVVTCTNGPVAWSEADRGDPTTDLGAEQCAIVDLVEQDYLNPDGFIDLDVAFDANEVRAVLGDFCGKAGSKGDVSDAMVIIGETFSGVPFVSIPLDDVGVDQLLRVNK